MQNLIGNMAMDFKKNYFLRNMIDLEKTLGEYLTEADFNYVLFDKGEVVVWGDRTPIIFADEMAIINELTDEEINAIDKNGNFPPHLKVMTEQDFIYEYCLSALADWFKDKAKEIGEDDGICHIIWLDETFNGYLKSESVTTDVLGIYNSNEDDGLSFLVSDKNDSCQLFFDISDFHINELIDFVKYVEKHLEN